MRTQEVPFIASTAAFVDYTKETLYEKLGDFADSFPRDIKARFHTLPHLSNKLEIANYIAAADPSKLEAFVDLRGLGLLYYLGKAAATPDFSGTPSVIMPALPGNSFESKVDRSVYMRLSDLALRESGVILTPYELLSDNGIYEIGYLDEHILSRSAKPAAMLVEYAVTEL